MKCLLWKKRDGILSNCTLKVDAVGTSCIFLMACSTSLTRVAESSRKKYTTVIWWGWRLCIDALKKGGAHMASASLKKHALPLITIQPLKWCLGSYWKNPGSPLTYAISDSISHPANPSRCHRRWPFPSVRLRVKWNGGSFLLWKGTITSCTKSHQIVSGLYTNVFMVVENRSRVWRCVNHAQYRYMPSCYQSKSWGRYACWPLSCPMTPVVLPNVASASPHPGARLPGGPTAPSNFSRFFLAHLGCCGCHLHLHINEAHGLRWRQESPTGEASNKIRLIIWWSFFFKIRWVETHWWLTRAGGKAPWHP